MVYLTIKLKGNDYCLMDKIKNIVLVFIVAFLSSCTSNTIYKKPKNLIPKDTMVLLLTDLYLASSAGLVKNKNLEIKVKYMPLVYTKFKIDSTRFKKSNTFYLSNIDAYSELLNQVKDSLKNLKNKYQIKDSLVLKKRKKEKLKKLKKIVEEDS